MCRDAIHLHALFPVPTFVCDWKRRRSVGGSIFRVPMRWASFAGNVGDNTTLPNKTVPPEPRSTGTIILPTSTYCTSSGPTGCVAVASDAPMPSLARSSQVDVGCQPWYSHDHPERQSHGPRLPISHSNMVQYQGYSGESPDRLNDWYGCLPCL